MYSLHTWIRMSKDMCVCICACVHMCMWMYLYMCGYLRVHVYTDAEAPHAHTHTQTTNASIDTLTLWHHAYPSTYTDTNTCARTHMPVCKGSAEKEQNEQNEHICLCCIRLLGLFHLALLFCGYQNKRARWKRPKSPTQQRQMCPFCSYFACTSLLHGRECPGASVCVRIRAW